MGTFPERARCRGIAGDSRLPQGFTSTLSPMNGSYMFLLAGFAVLGVLERAEHRGFGLFLCIGDRSERCGTAQDLGGGQMIGGEGGHDADLSDRCPQDQDTCR